MNGFTYLREIFNRVLDPARSFMSTSQTLDDEQYLVYIQGIAIISCQCVAFLIYISYRSYMIYRRWIDPGTQSYIDFLIQN